MKKKSNKEKATTQTGVALSSGKNEEVAALRKINEQLILINKICIGALLAIIALLIMLLFFQGRTLNNDSYNRNIEYFINEYKQHSERDETLEELLRELLTVQKQDSVVNTEY